MKRNLSTTPVALLFLVPAVLILVALDSVQAQQNEKKAEVASQEDLFTVPEGAPEDLLEYIQKLEEQRPPELTPEKVRQFQQKQHEAIVRAAEKVIAAKPGDEPLQQAAISKAVALNHLARYGDKYEKQLERFPEDLKKAGHPELARDMKAFLLERELLQSRATGPGQLQKLLDRVQKFLAEGPLSEEGVRLAITTARTMQGAGDELAAKAYGDLGTILAKSDDESIADLGSKMEGISRRMKLVGNQMELEGVTMDGDPLDWSKYRGNVTLVMFWATWCGPCRQEIAHVQDLYQQYRDRGFDVVGISVDESREDLEEFLKENEISWTIVYDQARADGKKGQPMSARYGVTGIPETVLVDRKGKVVATSVRGSQLDEQLKEMIGPPEEKSQKKEG